MDLDFNVKRKRRSSLHNRRSKSSGGVITTGISETIDPSLSESQRLQTLVKFSLENAFSTLEREFSDSENLKSFENDYTQCINTIEQTVNSGDLYKLCVSDIEITESNSALNNDFPLFEKKIKRLKKEQDKWNTLLTNYKTDLGSESRLTSAHFKHPFDGQLFDKMNYSKDIADVHRHCQDLNFEVNELTNHLNKVETWEAQATDFIDRKNLTVQKTLKQYNPDTPRTLILKGSS